MKIVMFGHKRIPSREGGVEVVVEQLSTRMAAMGHQVVCCNRTGRTACGAPPRQWAGVCLKPVWTVDIKGLAAVSSSFFAALRSAFSDADVVHIHAEGPAFMCWLPKLFGKRVVVTVHGLDWRREKWAGSFGTHFIRAGEQMAARYADEIIVLSRNLQAYFLQTYNRETVWIPNGVEPPQPAGPEEIVAHFGLERDGYILYVGRLVPEKGVHYLIEAFGRVRTDKKLVIAGDSSDTDAYVRRLSALAKGDERIVFTGFVQGQLLRALYSNAYVYVLPSDLEGMPLSLLEAMSYGNCCLVSDIPACTEVVGNRGRAFAHGSVDALCAQLQQLCDDPDLVAQYRAGIADWICEKYDWDTVTAKTLELYQCTGKEARVLWAKKRI